MSRELPTTHNIFYDKNISREKIIHEIDKALDEAGYSITVIEKKFKANILAVNIENNIEEIIDLIKKLKNVNFIYKGTF